MTMNDEFGIEEAPIDSLRISFEPEEVDDVTQICRFLESYRFMDPSELESELPMNLDLLDNLLFRRKEYSSLEPEIECQILRTIAGAVAVSEIHARRSMFFLIQRFITSNYVQRILEYYVAPYHLSLSKLPQHALEIISRFAIFLLYAIERHPTGCYWMLRDVWKFINCLVLFDFSEKELESGMPVELNLTIRQLKVQYETVKMERKLLVCRTEADEGFDVDPVLQQYWLMFVCGQLITKLFLHASLRLWEDEKLRKWFNKEISNKMIQPYALIRSLVNAHSVPEKSNDAVFINYKSGFEENSLDFEANYSVRLTRYLLQQGTKPQQIVVATVGEANADRIRRIASFVLGPDNGIKIVDLKAVEREYEIIVISTACLAKDAQQYDLTDILKRMLMSRNKLYVLYSVSNVPLEWLPFSNMVNNLGLVKDGIHSSCKKHRVEQVVKDWHDFDSVVLEGGCISACNFRFPCGHMCQRQCHPGDHSGARCSQKCPKLCKQGLHPCPNLCFEDCGDCLVKTEKRLKCGHVYKDALCITPVDSLICKEECSKLLPCGHKCKMLCSQPCRGICTEVILKVLPCGHNKQMKCGDNNFDGICDVMVERSFPSCQHNVMMKCSADTSECPSVCGAPLPGCYHQCQAKCGECFMGRLHEPCKEKCNKVLICGHECTHKCSGDEMCPPCQQPCEVKCMHGECGYFGSEVIRRCGDDCQPCTEPCPNLCKHRACSKQCGLLCDVEPCNEPCERILKCRHRCTGVCGEICPDICRVCGGSKWEDASSIFFGREDNRRARFIKLVDCGHIIEVQGMDEHVRRLVENARYSENAADMVNETTSGPQPDSAPRASTQDSQTPVQSDPVPSAAEAIIETQVQTPNISPEAVPTVSSIPASVALPETDSSAPGPATPVDAQNTNPAPETGAPMPIVLDFNYETDSAETDSAASKSVTSDDSEDTTAPPNTQDANAPSQAEPTTRGAAAVSLEQEVIPLRWQQAVVRISCPKCRTVIKRSRRYQKILNQNMADIAQIKKRIRGRSREELVEERAKIVNAMNAELSATIPDPVLNAELAPVLERIKDMASDVSKWEEADACENSLKRLADISKLFVELARLATSIHESELLVTPLDEQFPNVANFGKRFFGDFTVKAKLVMVFAEISEYFFLNAVRLSTPMLRQLSYEIYRAQQLNNIGIILTAFAKASADFPIQQIQNYDKLCEIILDESEINDESTEVVETAIDELKSLNADATVCLSEAERVLIRQAVQGQVTTWYKCRNGHYFGIGECGRPMEKALCPDCKSEIGGENHVVMEGTTPTDF